MAKIIPLLPVDVKRYDPTVDGVTFSLLQKFKNCREAARLYLKGWKSKNTGMGRVFGTITHSLIQKVYEDIRAGKLTSAPSEAYCKKHIARIDAQWRADNPKADATSLERLEVTCILAEAVLPAYFKYWEKDYRVKWEKPETVFKHKFVVEHRHSKERMKTFLRGKMDASFFNEGKSRPWLLETKTKSRIGEEGESNLTDILPHEMQVGIYLMILSILHGGKTPGGLLYNIVRRPTSKPKKNESFKTFAHRIAADVRKRPDYYFLRLRMTVDKEDLYRRKQELEDVVSDFLMWWKGDVGHYKNSDYCENKYGACEYLPICGRGDRSKHYRTPQIFSELEEQ